MSNKRYGKRMERKVATRAHTISVDVKRGILWAGTELVKDSQIAGRDVKQVGRTGKRIGSATRQSLIRAGDRLKARNRARVKRA
jgi:hypothetical protein